MDVREHPSELAVDTSRVVARLFLPGEVGSSHDRAKAIVARVGALSAERVTAMADELLAAFAPRHRNITDLFLANARVVRAWSVAVVRPTPPGALPEEIEEAAELDRDAEFVLGASFTAEYAVEGAALCNPSAVVHPDQSGLPPGAIRVAIALRQIGEGHLSSIGFVDAVIDGGEWTFEERAVPLVTATVTDGVWPDKELSSALSRRTTGTPPRTDRPPVVEVATPAPVTAYRAEFPHDTRLGQRVLLPNSPDESRGMEDARFVRVLLDDGTEQFRATYTAYDGSTIASKLLVSSDLRTFSAAPMSGAAAQNKGMALFPRLIGGTHFAITRSGGEKMSLARSTDGYAWGDEVALHGPTAPWEIVQTGNCGPPIETDRGWLVLTHGVGPMRTYSIGAMLLDLDDPSRVLALSAEPILRPDGDRRNGYVPNVVYSCGSIAHEGRLFIPYGIGDARIGVVSVDLEDLLDSLTAV